MPNNSTYGFYPFHPFPQQRDMLVLIPDDKHLNNIVTKIKEQHRL